MVRAAGPDLARVAVPWPAAPPPYQPQGRTMLHAHTQHLLKFNSPWPPPCVPHPCIRYRHVRLPPRPAHPASGIPVFPVSFRQPASWQGLRLARTSRTSKRG